MIAAIFNHSLTAVLPLILALTACSSVNIQTSSNVNFETGNYRSYQWLTPPLPQGGRRADPIYHLDPAIRTAIEEGLQRKGYTLHADTGPADFIVSYIHAPGFLSGVEPEHSDTLYPVPRVRDLRPTDQASVDNAIALAGVKQTTDITITLIDANSSDTLWSASVSMIVEDANNKAGAKAQRNLSRFVKRALRELPAAK